LIVEVLYCRWYLLHNYLGKFDGKLNLGPSGQNLLEPNETKNMGPEANQSGDENHKCQWLDDYDPDNYFLIYECDPDYTLLSSKHCLCS
jgi:hypothetical protein